eukprot:6655872-Pyramimonas_sp.AAC.1
MAAPSTPRMRRSLTVSAVLSMTWSVTELAFLTNFLPAFFTSVLPIFTDRPRNEAAERDTARPRARSVREGSTPRRGGDRSDARTRLRFEILMITLTLVSQFGKTELRPAAASATAPRGNTISPL